MKELILPKTDEALVLLMDKNKLEEAIAALGATAIEKDANGSPVLIGSSLKMSLSHKDDKVVIAVCDSEIGVDIENLRNERNFERLTKLFGDEKPTNLYEFYKLWTAKEAEGKRQKVGVTTEILQSKVDDAVYNEWGDYLICTVGAKNVRFEVVD